MALGGMKIAVVTPGRLFIIQINVHDDREPSFLNKDCDEIDVTASAEPLKLMITDPNLEKPRSRGFMRDAHFIDGGRALLICYLDTKEVVVWSINPWRRIWQCPLERRIGNSDWSPSSNALAIWNLQNGVDVYHLTDTCEHVGNFPVEIRNQPAMQVQWGFYGECVISGSHKGRIYVWGTQTGKILQILQHGKRSQIIQAITYFSPNYHHHMIASACQPTSDGERPIIKIWQADTVSFWNVTYLVVILTRL
ncbi:uncharacterized protein LACBIDRAFT_304193 [Laccaria bicolor S238N-H82]|uniref:Predicted protein n=1 Tax=Laccaria bicolor (strain S238N-H82 / ATCC MYA-4686) TaxID=486041 RepID=B0DL58_LACBS|nr:uncharacterized protein LACBIDRAFT_304193 [Laccaria bicolor S238N-H82]EDR04853.1 predicted protein [Laccaria bicolor S238N-H82]|eukprot:XP_001884677.1 predicted protein [Laccaria bicolor S238N-H82]